jgi:hypothetical protein
MEPQDHTGSMETTAAVHGPSFSRRETAHGFFVLVDRVQPNDPA